MNCWDLYLYCIYFVWVFLIFCLGFSHCMLSTLYMFTGMLNYTYNKAKWHQHAELTIHNRPPSSGRVTLQHLATGQSKHCIKESNAHEFISVLLAIWENSEENIKCRLGKSLKKSRHWLHVYGQDRYNMTFPYTPHTFHIYEDIRKFFQCTCTLHSWIISFPSL